MKFGLLLSAFLLSTASFAASQLDDLIRGEMSAVKAYDQVIPKIKDKSEYQKLNAIRENHVAAVKTLKSFANADVKEDTETVGPWGTFVKAYTGTAKILGDKTAVKALLQGEEHGVNEYQEALKDENIAPEVKRVIKQSLLPKQEKHIQSINASL